MDYRVVFRESFIQDLERIVQFVAEHDPSAAERLGNLIVREAERLAFFPERHPRVRRRPGIRRFVIKNYFKVFYRVRPESRVVEVLRCWDGRRQFDPV